MFENFLEHCFSLSGILLLKYFSSKQVTTICYFLTPFKLALFLYFSNIWDGVYKQIQSICREKYLTWIELIYSNKPDESGAIPCNWYYHSCGADCCSNAVYQPAVKRMQTRFRPDIHGIFLLLRPVLMQQISEKTSFPLPQIWLISCQTANIVLL